MITSIKQNSLAIKLIDFGLSTILVNSEKTNNPCGTLAYLSPEVINYSPYDKRTDIWALGVILHCMLVRYLPFITPNIRQT